MALLSAAASPMQWVGRWFSMIARGSASAVAGGLVACGLLVSCSGDGDDSKGSPMPRTQVVLVRSTFGPGATSCREAETLRVTRDSEAGSVAIDEKADGTLDQVNVDGATYYRVEGAQPGWVRIDAASELRGFAVQGLGRSLASYENVDMDEPPTEQVPPGNQATFTTDPQGFVDSVVIVADVDDPNLPERVEAQLESRSTDPAGIEAPADARPFGSERVVDYYFSLFGVDPACGQATPGDVERLRPCLEEQMGDVTIEQWVALFPTGTSLMPCDLSGRWFGN